MAVNIDELHVETQPPPAQSAPAAGKGASQQSPQDIYATMERLNERKLRLQAD
jgi:hypothetical protein